MAITLDGHTYNASQNKVPRGRKKPGSLRRGVTGVPDRTSSGIIATRFKYTLRCTLADLNALETSFAKDTPSTNKLDFVDASGFDWNPGAGTNDATHAYNTGVYFISMGDEVPVLKKAAWDSTNRWLVDIELVPISTGLAS